jgi:hypothetical protein
MKRKATIAVVVLALALGGFSLDLTRPMSVCAKCLMPYPGLTVAPSHGSGYNCHNAVINDGLGILQVFTVPPTYTPGQSYLLVAAITRAASTRWGFELTALRSGGQMAGSFGDSSNAVGEQTSLGIEYVSQTTLEGFDGTYADSLGAGWAFQWTAPPQGSGTVTFYAAGAACNNDNAVTGDYTYTTSVSSSEGAATAVESTTWGKIKQIYR